MRDLGEGTVEVGFHLVAHGVNLHADFFDFGLGGGPAEATGQKGCGGCSGCGFKKRAAVHGMQTHDGVPPMAPLGAEVESRSIIRGSRELSSFARPDSRGRLSPHGCLSRYKKEDARVRPL